MKTIQLFGDIGTPPCTPDAVSAALANAGGEPVCVEINTAGGSVWDGLAIYNALTSYPGRVTCKVVGLAASMGSVIALAGDELRMASNAFLMIHNPTVCVEGDAAGLHQTAEWMEKVHGTLATVYETRSGRPNAEILAAMNAETWFTAEEAVEWGFADSIEQAKQQSNQPTVRQAAAAYRAHKPQAAAPTTADPQLIMKEVDTMAKNAIRGAAAKPAPKNELPIVEEQPMADEYSAPAAPAPSPETVQPVDTSSPNYAWGEKCGAEGIDTSSPEFVAGYAAGLSSKAAPAEAAPEAEVTPEEEKPVAKAATIAALRAAFPGDSDTVFTAIENGWTVEQAKAHAFDKVQAKLTDVSAKLAKATTGQGPVATAGVRPAASKPAADDPKAQAEHEWDNDPEARKGFSTKDRFVVVRTAELRGQLRVAR